MFSPDQWAASTGVAFYNGVATQSLRFDDGSSAYLSRTPSSAGNRKTWTWSGWIKRSNLGSEQTIFSAGTISSSRDQIRFESNDKIGVYFNNGTNGSFNTTQVFRDSSSWYHILLNFDSAQATALNRRKLYINGVQVTSFSSNSDVTLNTDSLINNTNAHNIGRDIGSGSAYVDSYLAEVNFVDGTALDPTSFGETKNGIWIPKAYTGSYGTNGFRLQFNQTGTGTASSSTIGADTSGNANHFSSSGIVASDCDMPDSPENNFATWNRLSIASDVTLAEGNLQQTQGATYRTTPSTFFVNSGKWYFEMYGIGEIGVVRENEFDITTRLLTSSGDYAYNYFDGKKFNNNVQTSYGANWISTDVVACLLDLDSGVIEFFKNGVSQGNAFTSLPDGYYAFATGHASQTIIANFGQDSSFSGNKTAQGYTDANGIGDFYYEPPTDALALCSANLPEPTISPNAGDGEQADDYFNTVLYTGDGTTSQTITGVGFAPDFVWIKSRTSADWHAIHDKVRGVNLRIVSNSTNAESSDPNFLNSFDVDGFKVGLSGSVGGSGKNYVAWNWKAGGTAVSNTDGSITSSVSANTDAGFSIVTYTGTGANATVGHGLNVAPNYMIIKSRDSSLQDWTVYSEEIGNTKNMALNTTGAEETATTNFNSTSPTSTVFSIGTRFETNESGVGFVAYCFHDVDGYSKFGSYTGNGSTDGTFVYTGFRPAWVLLKRTDGTASWSIRDNVRNDDNPADLELRPDSSIAEYTESGGGVDLLSNGFKCRTTTGGNNISGGTYIYMAFAENPFKYANAR